MHRQLESQLIPLEIASTCAESQPPASYQRPRLEDALWIEDDDEEEEKEQQHTQSKRPPKYYHRKRAANSPCASHQHQLSLITGFPRSLIRVVIGKELDGLKRKVTREIEGHAALSSSS
jgi:hypothetical protein